MVTAVSVKVYNSRSHSFILEVVFTADTLTADTHYYSINAFVICYKEPFIKNHGEGQTSSWSGGYTLLM